MRNTTSIGNQRGGVFVFLVAAMIPIIALLALAIDGFSLTVSKLEQENNAEYAALAALNDGIDSATGYMTLNRDASRIQRAELVAGRNSYLGNRSATPVDSNEIAEEKAGKINMGYYDKTQRRFFINGKCAARGKLALNAVKLSLNTMEKSGARAGTRLLPFFAQALGYKSHTIQSSAIAYYDLDRKASSIAPRDASIIERNPFDINDDGVVDIQDVRAVIDIIRSDEWEQHADVVQAHNLECYDFDNSGRIDLSDLRKIRDYIGSRDNAGVTHR